VTFLKLKTCVF